MFFSVGFFPQPRLYMVSELGKSDYFTSTRRINHKRNKRPYSKESTGQLPANQKHFFRISISNKEIQ